MTKEEIQQIVREEMVKELPNIFGRSLYQVKIFLIKNIK